MGGASGLRLGASSFSALITSVESESSRARGRAGASRMRTVYTATGSSGAPPGRAMNIAISTAWSTREINNATAKKRSSRLNSPPVRS